MDYRRLSRCGIDGCKQTLYYVESGQFFCKNGHLREGELEVTADDEGFGPTGARATRAPVENRHVSKVLRGRKGFELYIQCLQIILQKQVWWLIHERGLPAELEVIVRDLWALRLQIVSSTLSTTPASSAAPTINPDASSHSSSYLYSSSSAETSASRPRRYRRGGRRKAASLPSSASRPKLLTNVVLCYLGCLLLHIPITHSDLQSWIASQSFPYIRALRLVPDAMRNQLSAEYWVALDPLALLSSSRIFRATHNLIVEFHTKFGISFPPVNRECLVARYVDALGLPLECYTAALRLADHLFAEFSWPALAARLKTAHWPEARLMALVVIAAKLWTGLDGITRTAGDPAEPAATGLEWEAWKRFLESKAEGRRMIDVKEKDVLLMSGEDLDDYMDWYEKTWCDEDEVETSTKLTPGILNLFPATRPPTSSATSRNPDPTLKDKLRTLHSSSLQHPTIPPQSTNERGIMRPGEQFLWNTSEEQEPLALKMVMLRAAEEVGLSKEDFRKVLGSLETEFRDGIKTKRRNERRKSGA